MVIFDPIERREEIARCKRVIREMQWRKLWAQILGCLVWPFATVGVRWAEESALHQGDVAKECRYVAEEFAICLSQHERRDEWEAVNG